MGNSKHRKNHKKKAAAFKQKSVETQNRVKKFQKQWIEHYMQQQEYAKKEQILEVIYKNRPELVLEKDGVLLLNKEAVETQNGILVWKTDNNPILAGLEPLENYTQYTEEVVNDIFFNMIQKAKMRLAGQAGVVAANADEPILNLTPTQSADFTLVEDPTFVEQTEASDSETKTE